MLDDIDQVFRWFSFISAPLMTLLRIYSKSKTRNIARALTKTRQNAQSGVFVQDSFVYVITRQSYDNLISHTND